MKMNLVLVSLTLATMSFAQPPQGKRDSRRREQTGPGGISWAAYGFNGLGIVRLLEVPEIQTALKFTDEDKAALPLLRQEFSENDEKYKNALTTALSQSKDAFKEALALRSKEIDKQMAEVLGSRFQRFQEVRRQAFGVMASATADATVREALAITEDQRMKFNKDRDELIKKLREQAGQGNKRVEAGILDQGMRDFAAKEEQLFLSLLTEPQASKWKALLGDPLEIPDEVVRFIRRGRFDPAQEGDRPTGRIAKGGMKREFRKKGGNRPPSGDAEKKPPF
jgi:hypothetical protein